MRNETDRENRKRTVRTAAILLAAGLGERMHPLSSIYPKPLLPILGVPLFRIICEKLLRAGATAIHCNLFHLASRIEEFSANEQWPLFFHHEVELLGTGGGIGNMARDLSGFDLILLHNGDILAGIDYHPAISLHRARGALMTMIVIPSNRHEDAMFGDERGTTALSMQRPHQLPPAAVTINGTGEVTHIGRAQNRHERDAKSYGYTGMAILSPEVLSFFPESKRIGLVEVLLSIIENQPGAVIAYNAMNSETGVLWGEVGTPAGYLDIHRMILIDKAYFDPLIEPPPLSIHIGAGASVDPGARWKGFLEIGPRAVIEKNTALENCIILEGTTVREGLSYRESILFPNGVLRGESPN